MISKKKILVYEPLGWNDFFEQRLMFEDLTPVYISGDKGPILFCLHGLGLSAMSFSALAAELKESVTLVTFDWRGHGESLKESLEDFSQVTLLADALAVLRFVTSIAPYSDRSIIICGHSMGGAMAAKLVQSIGHDPALQSLYLRIKSLFVIDVVEGTALEALPMMEQIVKTRPKDFDSLTEVIKYGHSNRLSKHIDAA